MSDELERELRVMLRDRATLVGDDLEVPADLETRVRRARARRPSDRDLAPLACAEHVIMCYACRR